MDDTRSTLPVLMYHSVSDVADGPLRSLAVPPARLREQLAALQDAGFALTGLTEALHRKAAEPTAKIVGVTFDDGYLDFLTAGVPVLHELGAGATLYVSVGHIGHSAAHMATTNTFGPLLSWDQVREVGAAGVEIGNHSLIHEPMDVLTRDSLERQVSTSKERLEQECGTPIPSFAYPHGYNNRRVRGSVAQHGYTNACEVGRRLYQPGTDNVFAIPRLQITPDHSGAQTLDAVLTGGPALVSHLKRAAQPGWRATRWTAQRVLGKRLT